MQTLAAHTTKFLKKNVLCTCFWALWPTLFSTIVTSRGLKLVLTDEDKKLWCQPARMKAA